LREDVGMAQILMRDACEMGHVETFCMLTSWEWIRKLVDARFACENFARYIHEGIMNPEICAMIDNMVRENTVTCRDSQMMEDGEVV
jgi:hypothetical protein